MHYEGESADVDEINDFMIDVDVEEVHFLVDVSLVVLQVHLRKMSLDLGYSSWKCTKKCIMSSSLSLKRVLA